MQIQSIMRAPMYAYSALCYLLSFVLCYDLRIQVIGDRTFNSESLANRSCYILSVTGSAILKTSAMSVRWGLQKVRIVSRDTLPTLLAVFAIAHAKSAFA